MDLMSLPEIETRLVEMAGEELEKEAESTPVAFRSQPFNNKT